MSIEESPAVDGDTIEQRNEDSPDLQRKDSHLSQDSQTATDFINSQLRLEADAREVLPYSFDSCTHTLGPLRQGVFACLTCNPPPASAAQVYNPAGVCYSCSISCHGDHTLVELFNRRNFVCDCGTTRFSSTTCTLRANPVTGTRGVTYEEAAKSNTYNHNFKNQFCGCGEDYDAHQEKGTMFQCIGLGTVETGGCGEDWWHPECVMGLPRDWNKAAEAENIKSSADGVDEGGKPAQDGVDNGDKSTEDATAPPGFPDEEDFEAFICYKCVESNPWIKKYAGTSGFLPPVFKKSTMPLTTSGEPSPDRNGSRKRKASEELDNERAPSPFKRVKEEKENGQDSASDPSKEPAPKHKHDALPPAPEGVMSMFLKEDFREHLCHCPACFIHLVPHPQLVEEEETYEPPLSESEDGEAGPGSGARSHATGSLLDRGEAALSTMDRVKAIEGVMVYNHLKDKVKDFLKPFAENGKAVTAEEVKAYFEKLRGDETALRDAASKPNNEDADDSSGGGGKRKEQSGY